MKYKELGKYYSNGTLLSFHRYLNFIIGHRGVGKTYDFKKWCISDFLKTGMQYVWVRRYKQETKQLVEYFNDLIENKAFEGHKLEIKGDSKGGRFLIDDKVMGFYITLSVSSSFKSTPYPLVDKIIFDEFLIDKTTYRYLRDEVTVLLDLIFTVFRDRDDVKGVFCIANNISFTNPYFLYYHIQPFKERFKKFGTEVLVENYKNETYIKNIYNTHFGRLVKGTTYGEYAIENVALRDNNTFIEKRPSDSKFKFYIKYKSYKIGFWIDESNGILYACREYDPSTYAKYCLTRDDHEPNLYLIKNINNTHIKDLKFMFQAGLLRFSDNQVKDICYEFLAYFVR